MKQRVWWVLFLGATACAANCIPTTGDRILGSDLAAAEPALAGLPATFIVGFAPGPGGKRTLSSAELGHIARSNGIRTDNLHEICFEFPLRLVEAEEVSAAMRRSLPADVHLEIVEFNKSSAPAGEVEFPATGLEPGDAAGNHVWRGWVRYANTRKVPISARVKILHDFIAVVAQKDLAAGVPLESDWLRIEKRAGPSLQETAARRIEDVRGQILKRAVKAGAPILTSILSPPLAVKRGATVRVEVASGWARLHFEAIAESDAREGDMVALRNPVSGKTFRARAGANGRATVVIGGSGL